MAPETPYDWLCKVAGTNPHRACLMTDDALYTYADVRDRVRDRAVVLADCMSPGEIMPVEVGIDVGSIVEILAVQVAGGVPLPHVGQPPDPRAAFAEGSAICIATSGSMGDRKLVPLSYGNIAASVRASRERLGNGSDDRWLLCLPLNHVGGLSIVWRSLEAGGAVVVTPFESARRSIEQHRPTFASMVPTMVHRMVAEAQEAIASIGVVLVGGAHLGMSLWREALDHGVHLVPTYGLTEACSQVATLAPADERIAPGLVGTPLDGFTVSILDEDGEAMLLGEPGRIAIEGPAVFGGFLGEQSDAIPYVTADIGRMTSDGDLLIEGRIDDVIVSGGENVSLSRVADAIRGFRGVKDVCVVGLDDPHWGATAGAMVVASHRVDVMDPMVQAVLEPHERPKRWITTDEIPTLENGKHDIGAVKAAFEEEPWI
ncbi:MAG: AMP-binding protein [Actinomycetota bacterium]